MASSSPAAQCVHLKRLCTRRSTPVVVNTRRAYWCHPSPSSAPLHRGHASCVKPRRSVLEYLKLHKIATSRVINTYPFSVPQVLHSQQVQQVHPAVVMTECCWVQIFEEHVFEECYLTASTSYSSFSVELDHFDKFMIRFENTWKYYFFRIILDQL